MTYVPHAIGGHLSRTFVLTLFFWSNGKTRHDVEALGAVHDQWAGTAIGLRGTRRSTRTKAANTNISIT